MRSPRTRRTAKRLAFSVRLALRYDRTERTMAPLLILGMVLINLRRLVERSSETRS